jgi:hypothetical protein
LCDYYCDSLDVFQFHFEAKHPEHPAQEARAYVATFSHLEKKEKPMEQRANGDPVHHPSHYTSHPSGVECIAITEHMSFNLGNAIKYLWRADEKGAPVQDLEKAVWYIQREISLRKRKTAAADSAGKSNT